MTSNPRHTCDNTLVPVTFSAAMFIGLSWDKTQGTIQAADTCQHSWILKEAMSHHPEHDSKNDESSQKDMEYHSKSGCESEDVSTASSEDGLHSIWYHLPPHFLKPYLWDFRNTRQALKYITKHINLEAVSNGLKSFSDLSTNWTYSHWGYTECNQ